MAKTFKDFMIECENFDYSQEYYDLMKECSELSLMEKYIENQLYMAYYPISESASLDEGYLMESVNEDELQIITEKALEKAKNIGSKIGKGLAKLFKSIISFFKKFVKQIDDLDKDAKYIRNNIQSIKISQGDTSKILALVGDVYSASETNVNNRGNKAKIKLKFDDGIEIGDKTLANQAVYISIADGSVQLFPYKKAGDYAPLAAEDIAVIMRGIRSSSSAKHVYGILANLMKAVDSSKKYGITIAASATALQKFINEYEQMYGYVENIMNEGMIDSYAAEKLSEIYKVFNGCLSLTIKEHSNYLRFKRQMIKTLKSFVDSNRKTSNNKNKDDSKTEKADNGKNK